jgi:hypothetical protein
VFSFFKKSEPSIPYTDKVWKKAEYALKGMLMMAMMRLQHGKSCLIVSFFESEAEALIRFMREHKLDFVRLDGSIPTESAKTTLFLTSASDLNHASVLSFLKLNSTVFSSEALFTSHYPMSAFENTTLQILTTAGFSKFVFGLSFDDPLLKIFNSQNILPLLEKLGLEEEESIEHNMVTQSIKRARQKVESKIKFEAKAKSPEEWFALNVK